jgi:hypothetical protein
VSALIQGRDVISDYSRLEAAAGEIGIDDTLLERALQNLEEVGYVRLKTMEGGRVIRVQESVPLLSSAYDGLGAIWEKSKPSELEAHSMAVLDDACLTPVETSSIVERHDVSMEELDQLVDVGQAVGYLARVNHKGSRKEILYSPLHFDEHPQQLIELASRHPGHVLASTLETARAHQGVPAERLDERLVHDALALGALDIPAVESLAGEHKFVFAPVKGYTPVEKAVLQKARAIIACVRYGEHFGTITRIRDPLAILHALRIRGRLGAHTEIVYQYRVLRDLGIADIVREKKTGRYEVVFRPTADNQAALNLAIELVSFGETTPQSPRVAAVRESLTDGVYKPSMVIRSDLARRKKLRYSNSLAEEINAMIMGIPEELA